MKQVLLLILILGCMPETGGAQPGNNLYLRLSGGHMSFGTGDYTGYAIGLEVSKNVIAKPRWGLARLLPGGEILFEHGVKKPVIDNPTVSQFFSSTFRHTSGTILWGKAAWYPFPRYVKGFHIQAGPTLGYFNRSAEQRAMRVVDATGNATRHSVLSFDNGFAVGYRISTGIDWDIRRQWIAGFRLDFANNTKGEINTLAGVRTGIRL